MKNVFGMLNMVFSHLYIVFSVAGGMGPIATTFTEDWLHYLLIRRINRTIKQFIWFVVLKAFHCCNH